MVKRISKANKFSSEFIVEEFNNGVKNVIYNGNKIATVYSWYVIEKITEIDMEDFKVIYSI